MNYNDYRTQRMEFDMHKRKCEELRKVRVEMARTLGVPEVVRDEPCNYNGPCLGTCPACYMEEKALMDRIYELSNSGVVVTVKWNGFKKEPEPRMAPPKPTIVQGMLRPEPPKMFEPPTFPTSSISEPDIKKRGIFDKMKGER